MTSFIVRQITRLVFPFTILFGIYIILHGHLSPGGGFQGGVSIATGFLLLCVALGVKGVEKYSSKEAVNMESITGVLLAFAGVIGLTHVFFLRHVFSFGALGSLLSAGDILALNIAVGLKVAAVLIIIIYALIGGWGAEY